MRSATPVRRESLHASLVAPLREMIMAGELKPGEKVPEEALCQRFDVSRTPLREALKVLAAEGVLQIFPNRGAIVAQITAEQVRELYPIMASMERLAGRLACVKASNRQIVQVRTLHDRMLMQFEKGDEIGYLRSNRAIHEAIVKATGNETLVGYYQQILFRVHSSRFVSRKTREQWNRAMEEHEEIVVALEERDADRLGDLLERHVAGVVTDIAHGTFANAE